MKSLKISKYSDLNVTINKNFELIITDKKLEECKYPLIIGKDLKIVVPEYMYSINDFLSNRKDELTGNDVAAFLKLAQINLTPFVWKFMQDKEIDIFIYKNDLHVCYQDTYVVLNNRNMDFHIINRLYNVQEKPYMHSAYQECQEDLYAYIRNKISNSIGHNEIINIQMKDYKKTEAELEMECRKKVYNFPKILILYEKLIRIKENFLNENHYLIPQGEIDEIYVILQKIRNLLNDEKYSSKKYKVERL